MSNRHSHIDQERMQALLDGELSPPEARSLRAEIDSCARCTSEFEAWQTLFEDLGELPVLAPSTDFSTRILDSLPEPRRRGVAGWVARPAAAVGDHLSGELLQDFLDGALAARGIAKVEAHLDACAVCRTELQAHRSVQTALSSLPVLEPSHEFAERVMAGVRIRQMAALAMAPVSTRERVVAWLREMTPSTRQGWAAAMGVLVTPVTLVVLMVRSVLAGGASLSDVGAFAWLKASDLLGAAFAGFRDLALQQDGVQQLLNLIQLSGADSTVFAATGSALVFMTMAALWVLYRNVLTSPVGEGRYAHLPF